MYWKWLWTMNNFWRLFFMFLLTKIGKNFWSLRLKAENLQEFWDHSNNLFKQWFQNNVWWNNLLFNLFLEGLSYLKPNYFKKQCSLWSFLLTYGNNTDLNGNGVLNRVVSCLKFMELACCLLKASLDLYYYLK